MPEVTTKWFMILRSPTENENGDVSLHHHCNFFHEFRHSRMLLAGIQGPELAPRLKHSGVTCWESPSLHSTANFRGVSGGEVAASFSLEVIFRLQKVTA